MPMLIGERVGLVGMLSSKYMSQSVDHADTGDGLYYGKLHVEALGLIVKRLLNEQSV